MSLRSLQLDSRSRVALLAQALLEEISTRGLAEGDFFATEAALCTAHGVSRTIVREAVSRLHSMGVLTSVQKKGLVVAAGNPLASFAGALPVFARSSRENVRQLADLRYILEIGSIELAIRHRTAEQVERLRALAEAFAAADRDHDFPEQDRLDAQLHGLILEMTGSPMVAALHLVIADFFQSAAPFSDRPAGGDPKTVEEHRALAEAVAARDLDRARAVLRAQLESQMAAASAAEGPPGPRGGAAPPAK
jgi:GntR family transcriptional regulator, transcriptional repressor for pyruvate dehydrogenase complex